MDKTDQISFQPPPGFVSTESKLDGVTVFAPAPEVDLTPESQTFKCPQCGATTAFDPTAASVTCKHCGFTEQLTAEEVGRSAEELEFTLENLDMAERGWGEDRKELHCDSCGAILSLARDDLSSTCSFCGSNRVVARVAAEDRLRPRFLIPFKLKAEDCKPRAREWLGRGWMHPGDLTRAGTSAVFKGVYLPFWTFDANIHAQWKAEVGYERTERYYDSHSKTWKTRTRIDWRWESGRAHLSPDDWLGIGTTKVSHVLLERIYPFDLSSLSVYDPGFLAGWQALTYDIVLGDAWNTVKEEMREKSREVCRDQIRSTHVRNFSMAADFADETWRYILLPVFVAAYRYNGEVFQLLVNGQTGNISGQKPVAWWKVWLAIGGLLSPGILLGLVGLVLLLFGGLGVIPLGIGAVLFVIGIVLSVVIFRKAMQAGEV
jgi:DNA-directed RNA polymerase subunit RPC12/RpoP